MTETLKWENQGGTYRARSSGKAERWWTIRPFDDGGWYLRAPDGVGTVHASLKLAKATALADFRMGVH